MTLSPSVEALRPQAERAGFAFMLIAVTSWGASFIWLKLALVTIPPGWLAALRFGLASAILIVAGLMLPTSRRRILSLDLWRVCVPIGLIGTFLPNLLQNYGMLRLDAGMSGIVQGMGPIYTAILAAMLLREPFGFRKVAGSAAAFLGTVLLSLSLYGMAEDSISGVVLLTLSAVAYALYTVSVRKSLIRSVDPFALLVATSAAGTMPLFLFAIVAEPIQPVLQIGGQQLTLVLLLAAFPTLLAYACYVAALARLQASRAAAFIFLVPVVALILATVYLRESVTYAQAAYGLLVVAGVATTESEAPT